MVNNNIGHPPRGIVDKFGFTPWERNILDSWHADNSAISKLYGFSEFNNHGVLTRVAKKHGITKQRVFTIVEKWKKFNTGEKDD